MLSMPNYDVSTRELTVSTLGNTVAEKRFCAKYGVDPNTLFLKVQAGVDPEAKNYAEAQAHLEDILRNGFTLDNHKYVVYQASSGELRNGQFRMIREDLENAYNDYFHFGVVDDTKNMVANKMLVYRSVSTSSSYYDFRETFGFDPPRISKVAIFPDVVAEVEGTFDHVESDKVTRGTRKVPQKITDGVAYILRNDDDLTPPQRDELRKTLRSCTLRFSGMKTMAVFLLKSDLRSALRVLRLSGVVTDSYGVTRNLLDLDMFTFNSSFKWIKCVSDWNAFVDAAEKSDLEISVCVKDHDGVADLPYQQFQTLSFDEKTLKHFTDRTLKLLEDYRQCKSAAKLLPGALGKVAKLYPEILKDSYAAELARRTYRSRRWGFMGGRIPDIGRYLFAAPDTVAVLQGMHGKAPIGIIPRCNVICNLLPRGVIVDVTRCPHLDNAHLLRKSYKVYSILKNLYTGNTVYFSALDASMTAVQMDFDGDHVLVSMDPYLVQTARASIRKYGNVPLFYEAQGDKPGEVTEEDVVQLLLRMQAAPVGLYANAIMKIWAKGTPTASDMRDIAFLTKKANTCIDAAKTGLSEEESGAAAAMARMRKVPNPLFQAYAKSSAEDPAGFGEREENCAFYATSSVDVYSRSIAGNSEAELTIEDLPEGDFDWHMLTTGKACRKALAGIVTSKDDRAAGHEGVFNRLSFMCASDWSDAGLDDCDVNASASLSEQQRQYVREVIFGYAVGAGYDVDVMLDSIVMALYTTTKSAQAVTEQLKRTLWACFGEELLRNVQANLSALSEAASEEA